MPRRRVLETRPAMVQPESGIHSKRVTFDDGDDGDDSDHSDGPYVAPLAREIPLLSCTSIMLCALFVATETGRSCIFYAGKYINEDAFPVDPSIIVIFTEATKAAVVIAIHFYKDNNHPFTNLDPRILAPCALYAVTNNLAYAALHYVSPAIWQVLCQTRVIFLFLIYRFVRKQKVTTLQYIGALILIFGVGMAQMDQDTDFKTIIGPALGIGAAYALLSASAAVVIEVVLKQGSTARMWRNQTHLYCGGTVFSIIPILLSQFYFDVKAFDIRGSPGVLAVIVVVTVLLAVLNGICVSLVIQKLDNVVRFQILALCYVLTAGLNKLLFPEKFNLGPWYVLSFVVMFFAVLLINKEEEASVSRARSARSAQRYPHVDEE